MPFAAVVSVDPQVPVAAPVEVAGPAEHVGLALVGGRGHMRRVEARAGAVLAGRGGLAIHAGRGAVVIPSPCAAVQPVGPHVPVVAKDEYIGTVLVGGRGDNLPIGPSIRLGVLDGRGAQVLPFPFVGVPPVDPQVPVVAEDEHVGLALVGGRGHSRRIDAAAGWGAQVLPFPSVGVPPVDPQVPVVAEDEHVGNALVGGRGQSRHHWEVLAGRGAQVRPLPCHNYQTFLQEDCLCRRNAGARIVVQIH